MIDSAGPLTGALMALATLAGCDGADVDRSEPVQQKGEAAVSSGRVEVNGLGIHYEVQGDGTPLVLLHGGLSTIGHSFGGMRPALARKWRTIAIEQQGHGHTADIDRPLDYDRMADDTAAVLAQLGIGRADVVGWSDGGVVALRLAKKHPAQVRKVVGIGTFYRLDGIRPEFVAETQAMRPDDGEIMGDLRDLHARANPKPGDWPRFVEKIKALARFPGWPMEELRTIEAPVLFVLGDRDLVRPDHADEMLRLLPHAQLAVVPGADHFVPVTHPDMVRTAIERFLAAPMPANDAVG